MSSNTLLTSIVTGGTNSHTTTAEEANALSTDFVTQGVVGAITLNTGSGGTGSFCVNQDASADMGVTIKAGQAYVTATPSSQNSQVLRVRASSDYTAYTINANASGSTKYDWIYLSISSTNANNPASDASNVASFVTSRSSSNTTDNGTPPTYGLLLAIVTVANGASSITNGNITDKRVNASVTGQTGSLIVTQASSGQNAKIQAAGSDTNINIELTPKGTGTLVTPNNIIQANSLATNAITLGYANTTSSFASSGTADQQVTGLTISVTIPAGGRRVRISVGGTYMSCSVASNSAYLKIWDGSVGTGTLVGQMQNTSPGAGNGMSAYLATIVSPAAGSKTYNVSIGASSGVGTLGASANMPAFLLVEVI